MGDTSSGRTGEGPEDPARPPTWGLAPGIFPVKIRRPTSGRQTVLRPRLHALLDDGVKTGGVIVTGPAGSGKTVLVVDWTTHQRDERAIAWLTLDEGDQEPVRFAKYLIAAIGTTPTGAVAMDHIAQLPPESVTSEGYLLALYDAVARLTDDVVVVLDDFQEVVGSETEQVVRSIVQHRPEHLRLVVVSRSVPSLGQTRLQLSGQIAELSTEDLPFTVNEVRELLDLNGVDLTDVELRALHEHSAGWAAGLQLVASALRAAPDAASFITDVTAAGRLVGDYLGDEVFERQPAEIREFLLRASTVNPVCGDLADALTGRRGGGETLADLYRDHLFLDREYHMGDERCTWYRWHPLFATLLRGRLNGTDPEMAAELHRLASRWLRARGLTVLAVRHAVTGGDVEAAAEVVGECWLDLAVAGERSVLRSLLDLFDEDALAAHPDLAVASAFLRFRQRDLTGASRSARHASTVATSLPPERGLAVQAMAAAVRLATATMTGEDDEEALATARSVLPELSRAAGLPTAAERKRRMLLLYHLGTFESSRGRYDDAADHLHDAMAEATGLDVDHLVLRCRAQLALVDMLTGRLTRAQSGASRVLETAAERGWSGSYSSAIAQLSIAGTHVLRGEADAGLARLGEASALVHPADRSKRFRIGLLAHAALLTSGRVGPAREELERLHRLAMGGAVPTQHGIPLAVADARQLDIEGEHGRSAELVQGVAQRWPDAVEHPEWIAWRAQMLVRAGDAVEARRLLAPVVMSRVAAPTHVLALAVDAVAAAHAGQDEDARRLVELALGEASRERMILPLMLCGEDLRAGLEESIDRGTPFEDVALEVLRHLGAPGRRAVLDAEYVEPLTSRELEVLGQLPGTASTEELAERLFVSVNTLRTHMKHIHRKLGTSNRRETVARARALGLI